MKSAVNVNRVKFVFTEGAPLSNGALTILSLIRARRKDFARIQIHTEINNQPLPRKGFSWRHKLTEGVR